MHRRIPRLIDILIQDHPERRSELEAAANEFYQKRQEQMGQDFIQRRLITQHELETALAKQRAATGKVTKKDLEVLTRINNEQSERLLSRVEAIGLMCARLATAKGK